MNLFVVVNFFGSGLIFAYIYPQKMKSINPKEIR